MDKPSEVYLCNETAIKMNSSWLESSSKVNLKNMRLPHKTVTAGCGDGFRRHGNLVYAPCAKLYTLAQGSLSLKGGGGSF